MPSLSPKLGRWLKFKFCIFRDALRKDFSSSSSKQVFMEVIYKVARFIVLTVIFRLFLSPSSSSSSSLCGCEYGQGSTSWQVFNCFIHIIFTVRDLLLKNLCYLGEKKDGSVYHIYIPVKKKKKTRINK